MPASHTSQGRWTSRRDEGAGAPRGRRHSRRAAGLGFAVRAAARLLRQQRPREAAAEGRRPPVWRAGPAGGSGAVRRAAGAHAACLPGAAGPRCPAWPRDRPPGSVSHAESRPPPDPPALLSRAARASGSGRPRSGTTPLAALVLLARLRGDLWQDGRLWDLGREAHFLGRGDVGAGRGAVTPCQALTLEFRATGLCGAQPLWRGIHRGPAVPVPRAEPCLAGRTVASPG